MLPLTQILINSLLFTGIFALVVWGSLWWNSRIWMHDFPKAMQEALPPLSQQEKRQQYVFGAVLIGVMIGLPILLNAQLRGMMGAAFTFPIAYLNTWLMLQAANLYDAIGIDLYITIKPPRFAVPAGSEPYLHLLWDKEMHLRNFFKGLIGMSVWALPLAVVALV